MEGEVNKVGALLLLVASLLATGCGGAAAKVELTPVERVGQRVQLEGFSIVPPQGEHWFVAPSLPKDEVWRSVAAYVKQTDDDTPGNIIWATVAVANLETAFQSREQLLESIIRARHTELRAARFRLHEFRSAPAATPGCYRYEAVTEDRGVTQHPGVVFLLSLRHLICLHPDSPTLAVNVAYSVRRQVGRPAVSLESEGEPFIGSLKFAALTRPAVVATIDVQQDPQGVATDGRAVWVAELGSNSVVRIDPKTNVVAKRYVVGNRPVGLAIGEGAVWVAASGSDEVWSIDLQTDEVRGQPIRVGRGPADIAVGYGSVWVTNMANGTVSRIDPRTRQLVATIPVAPESIGLAAGAAGVWVAGFKDSRVWRIDPRTNQIMGTSITVGPGPSAVVASPLGIWIASQSAAVSRIDETQGAVATIAVGRSASAVAVVGQQIWVTDYLSGLVWRLDAATQKVVGAPIPVGKGPVRLAAGGGAVWVTNAGSGTVSRIAGF
jgi:YVTN family beta-propeller protein